MAECTSAAAALLLVVFTASLQSCIVAHTSMRMFHAHCASGTVFTQLAAWDVAGAGVAKNPQRIPKGQLVVANAAALRAASGSQGRQALQNVDRQTAGSRSASEAAGSAQSTAASSQHVREPQVHGQPSTAMASPTTAHMDLSLLAHLEDATEPQLFQILSAGDRVQDMVCARPAHVDCRAAETCMHTHTLSLRECRTGALSATAASVQPSRVCLVLRCSANDVARRHQLCSPVDRLLGTRSSMEKLSGMPTTVSAVPNTCAIDAIAIYPMRNIRAHAGAGGARAAERARRKRIRGGPPAHHP